MRVNESLTVVSHDVFEGVQVLYPSLVSSEDLGPWAEVIREVISILLPHLTVATQSVDPRVERDVVGGPVTCGEKRENERKSERTCRIELQMLSRISKYA